MLVRLCAPAGEPVALGRTDLALFPLFPCANVPPVNTKMDSNKIDNDEADRLQLTERPLGNGSMNSF